MSRYIRMSARVGERNRFCCWSIVKGQFEEIISFEIILMVAFSMDFSKSKLLTAEIPLLLEKITSQPPSSSNMWSGWKFRTKNHCRFSSSNDPREMIKLHVDADTHGFTVSAVDVPENEQNVGNPWPTITLNRSGIKYVCVYRLEYENILWGVEWSHTTTPRTQPPNLSPEASVQIQACIRKWHKAEWADLCSGVYNE